MLRNRRDIQSLAYLAILPALLAWQWHAGFSPLLYAVALVLAVGLSVINHNHAHLPMWRHRRLNRLTTAWISTLQGHPAFVFHPAHIANHHRYHQGEGDLTRTDRFGGDHNHLLGYLLHPLHAIWVLYPVFLRYLARLRQRRPAVWRGCLAQYIPVLALWVITVSLSPKQAFIYVILPQLFGLHWLLAANYLQHAHADGHSSHNFARNFNGAVNVILFNIGLHTGHHRHPKAHWATLPTCHAPLAHAVDPRLNQGGLALYMMRTYVLALFIPRFRSQSLMRTPPR